MIRSASLEATWPERTAIAVIGVPVALFFVTWYRPLVGIPGSVVALWGTWTLMNSIRPSRMPSRRALLVLALIAVGWTSTTGLGGLFQQMWDHNFRNALLHDLIENSWPVVWDTPRGTVALDYYLAWSMVPALVGKLLGWKAATLSTAVMAGGGVFLVLLLFARVVGTWRWWLGPVFLLWSGLDVMGWVVRGGFPGEAVFFESWSLPLWYLSNQINFNCISHLVVPSWIVTLLIVGRQIGPGGAVALSAFLVPLAPFQAIGVAPFVLWALLQGDGSTWQRVRRGFTLENVLVPLVFLAICAPLYMANQGAGVHSGWFYELAPSPTLRTWVKFASFWILEILLPSAAIWFAKQRDGLLILAVAVLCVIPLRRAGLSNDLALKVSVPGLLILTLYTARAFLSSPKGWARWFLVGVFTLGSVTPLYELWVSIRLTRENRGSLEVDGIRTFDPTRPPDFAEGDFLVNFRSKPLEDVPALKWMLDR
jgi:hypothetical protein